MMIQKVSEEYIKNDCDDKNVQEECIKNNHDDTRMYKKNGLKIIMMIQDVKKECSKNNHDDTGFP